MRFALLVLAACGGATTPAPAPVQVGPVKPSQTTGLGALAGQLEGAWGRGQDVWTVGAVFDANGSKEMPSHGVIMHSPDGARSWQLVRRERPALHAIWGHGDLVIAVGSNVVRSVDGGKTWNVVDLHAADTMPAGTQLFAVTGHGRDVWAVGCTIGGFMNPGYIVRSRDAGATWTIAKRDIEGCPSTAMWTPNGHAIYAVGSFVGEEATHGVVVASLDDGATWRRTLLDDARVSAIGGGASGDVYVQLAITALVSRDGGAHFVPAPSVPVPLFDRRTWRDGTAVFSLDTATSTIQRRK